MALITSVIGVSHSKIVNMAKRTYEKTAIGRRLAALRKAHGFRTPEALAEAINDERITKSTLTNLELGKKRDITVTELLLIARTLEVNPVVLIVGELHPYAPSGVIDDMRNVDITKWFLKPNSRQQLQKNIDDILIEIRKLRAKASETKSKLVETNLHDADSAILFTWLRTYQNMLDKSRKGEKLIALADDFEIEIPDNVRSEICEPAVLERENATATAYHDLLPIEPSDLEY